MAYSYPKDWNLNVIRGDAERFWNHVDVGLPDECWPTTYKTGCRSGHAYMKFSRIGKAISVHRVAWMLTHGQIPDGLNVLHRCNNPKCCNPAHLYLGTLSDNAQDSIKAGTFNRVEFSEEDIKRIRTMLEEGYTQAHIARVVGCSQPYVSNINVGKRRS